ncbi:3-phosphoshikimate 1-carboxyvinyltransferase [Stackebrandtia nassauensis]|uniref:3-phosphoshikimate 1-carboxyvinyltransferase n=1 Tax=Stackebrandtia nassauensis (strain DSM 44728 / CIP 108903 / NRRL B-16338 / NBRC 102104 / LLR-40K-21) TaxID=446470 RepID=D3QBT8_STANL|nr:3-phosphoshikimate 1-carboxyvinyltransferase [Stackebrandtia nassauensis]ADD44827.1 3-phosphoshikimate 1-carboxyvinyltransferase [Stackebrandtia nassauensis DSM 44728]
MNDTRAPEELRWPAPQAPGAVRGRVSIPGSKSMMSRVLVLTAASHGASSVAAPLLARDSALMVAGLQAMGIRVVTTDDALWMVHPRAPQGPAAVDCGLAGTVMRFLPPLAAVAHGPITFDGDPYARKRPMAPLLRALTALGVSVDAASESLPFTIQGTGRISGGEITIDASSSSQFLSGLLLSAPRYDRGIVLRHQGPPVPSRPHVRMTVDMLRAAGAAVDDSRPNVWEVEPGQLGGRAWHVEPDLSNAAPFLAAALVTGGEVTVPDWPATTSQPGDLLRDLFTQLGGRAVLSHDGLTITGSGSVRGIDADLSEAGELTPVVAAVCALADSPSTLRGIGHLRGHETDRLAALTAELNRLGGDVTETDDGLRIRPRPLHGSVVDTYDDHRMAQAAAVLGLAVPDVVLSDVACTSKTLPQFPQLWTELVGARP